MPANTNNATLFQKLQVGMQADFGTPVPATKVLKSVSLQVDPNIETQQFFPDGNLFASGSDVIQEWTEGDISGVLTYTEIVYLLSAAFGPAVITQIAAAVVGPPAQPAVQQWVWDIPASKELSPVLVTLEKGALGATKADRVSSSLLTSLGFNWSRTDQITVEGSILGTAVENGSTLTTIATNPTVPTVRVIPPHVSIFSADTYAKLATPKTTATRLLRAFEAGISFDNLFSPVWALNALVTGHDGVVATRPDSESTLLLQADSAGRDFLAHTRIGQTDYISILMEGPLIQTAKPYSLKIDMAVQVTDVDQYDDSDGIYAIPYTFTPIDDGVNSPLKITLQTTLLAL